MRRQTAEAAVGGEGCTATATCGGVWWGEMAGDCSEEMRGWWRCAAAYCGGHELWQQQTATAVCNSVRQQRTMMACGYSPPEMTSSGTLFDI